MSDIKGEIIAINGPLVTVQLPGVHNGEQVRVGQLGLMGEVIRLAGEQATIQVYESTESLCPGEMASALGHPLSVELGPGLMGQIFDGVQRPLNTIVARSGDYIARGLILDSLSREQKWNFSPNNRLPLQTRVSGGTLLGKVQETPSISHPILVPPDCEGELLELAHAGEYTIEQIIAQVKQVNGEIKPLRLFHRWPVRTPRPYFNRDHAVVPLLTGQRILDTFFPLLKGGKGAVPGPFGAGKTMLQQQIARWANADIVIYVGCGERGNELVDILETFPTLTDPHTGRSLMERTLLVANTSNMPVVAREASIYVGVTIAEYYRDLGYDVVMVADSTSRWAEALREVAGRLGQMPVEEGHPAYLASRLAAFYERAGRVTTLSGQKASVTLIGAVSPPGGDFSEPVTSHTKEIVQTFWALSKELADARHYPSIDWNDSFSAYVNIAQQWWAKQIDPHWLEYRNEALKLLAHADELARIVNLVGPEALSATQQWVLISAALIREGVLQQSAVDEIDSFCSPEKQMLLLSLMLNIYHQGMALLESGIPVQQLADLPLLAQARRLKSQFRSTELDKLHQFEQTVRTQFNKIRVEYGYETTETVAV
ncbi:V-type ATPase subunit A [Thioploca ingrica]|uniref:V-type ATP synthase alpha chain n=1 Tax=Thioploca ingrica TaxID=40754 RepID=A0A090BUQ5_9GAMM|nr:V-type ATPase subunit A [Thioploca ingrica]